MATGEIKSEPSSLLLAWSGNHLEWLQCRNLAVLRCDTLPVTDVEGLGKALAELKSGFPAIQSVQFASNLPYFSLAPARVSSGMEEALQALHLGTDEADSLPFYTEAFGEEAALIERDITGYQKQVEAFWPQAKRVSIALVFLETVILETRKHDKPGCIAVHVGHERALMSLFANGELLWSMTTDDLAGDGILYHVVNAMKRHELEDGLDMEVWFSGQLDEEGELVQRFGRFFERVVVKKPSVEWAEEPQAAQHWNALANLLPCE